MNKRIQKNTNKRGVVWRTMRIIGAIYLFVYDKIRDDVTYVMYNMRLFIGVALFIVGLLSFASDRYCDGNTSNYYACTRPTTYYYYPWWSVMLIIAGSFFIVLWFLRKNKK